MESDEEYERKFREYNMQYDKNIGTVDIDDDGE